MTLLSESCESRFLVEIIDSQSFYLNFVNIITQKNVLKRVEIHQKSRDFHTFQVIICIKILLNSGIITVFA